MCCRGQILPDNFLQHSVDVELIQEGVKYTVNVTKMSEAGYFLSMNDSYVETECHRQVVRN